MLITFLRTLILYIVLIFGMRVMGKRQLGQLQPSELVITILISNIATLPIENSDVPLILGLIPILTLMAFDIILSFCTLKSMKLRRLVLGSTKILIKDGVINQRELAALRFSMDDLMEQLRLCGIFDLQEVDFALVETTGQLSVRKKSGAETLTAEAVGLNIPDKSPPYVVISDRQVIYDGLQNCAMPLAKLKDIIKKEGYGIEDIFLMTCTPQGEYYIVPVEE